MSWKHFILIRQELASRESEKEGSVIRELTEIVPLYRGQRDRWRIISEVLYLSTERFSRSTVTSKKNDCNVVPIHETRKRAFSTRPEVRRRNWENNGGDEGWSIIRRVSVELQRRNSRLISRGDPRVGSSRVGSGRGRAELHRGCMRQSESVRLGLVWTPLAGTHQMINCQ